MRPALNTGWEEEVTQLDSSREGGFILLLARLKIWEVSRTVKLVNSLIATKEQSNVYMNRMFFLFVRLSLVVCCSIAIISVIITKSMSENIKWKFWFLSIQYYSLRKCDAKYPTPGAAGFYIHVVNSESLCIWHCIAILLTFCKYFAWYKCYLFHKMQVSGKIWTIWLNKTGSKNTKYAFRIIIMYVYGTLWR